MKANLARFISEKWLSYDPKTGLSTWHMVAEFDDGKVREAHLELPPNGTARGDESQWKEVVAK